MAPRLPRLIPLAALCCLPALAVAQTDPCARDRVVLTRDEIRGAGILRLDELVGRLPTWDAGTVDGVGWRANAPGAGPPGTERWLLVIDGERIDVGPFERGSPHLLPLAASDVDSVVALIGPCLVAGGIAADGALLVHTADPSRGPSIEGRFTTGSETGDPGPFAFTPEATPNVDRYGDGLSARAGFGGERWSAVASLGSAEAVPTDPAIADRFVAAAGGVPPRIDLSSWHVALRARLGGGEHRLRAGGADATDFIRLPWVGRELAVREAFDHVSLAGSVPARGWGVDYSLLASWTRNTRRDGLPGPWFGWRGRTLAARLETGRASDGLRLGTTVRRVSAEEAAVAGSGATVTPVTLYARRPFGGTHLRATAVAALTLAGGEVGVEAGAGATVPLAPGLRARGSLAFARATRDEDRTPWGWASRGVPLPADGAIALVTPPGLPRRSRLSVDAALQHEVRPDVRVSVGGYWVRTWNEALARADYGYDPAAATFTGLVDVVADDGQVAGAIVSATARLGPLRGHGSYRLQGVVAGGARFRDAWAASPRHQLRGTIGWTPFRDVDLHVSGVVRSARRWPEYARAEVESGRLTLATVPAGAALDVAVQKWLWRRRIRGQFAIRNLFAGEYRLDPAGAVWEPGATAQIEMRLP